LLVTTCLVAPEAARAVRSDEPRGGRQPQWVIEAKEQMKVASAKEEPAAPKPVVFDCSKSGLQAVIDAAKENDIVELRGICHESVVIEEKRLTLRGWTASDPANNGVHGIDAPTTIPAVGIVHSPSVALVGLTISNGAGTGVSITSSNVTITDCDIDNNIGHGVVALDASNVMGLRVQINGNTRNGFYGARATTAFCDQCDIDGNGGWQGAAWFQSLVSIRDSSVTGTRGLQAIGNAVIDIDCTIVTPHACGLDASDFAGQADTASVVSFYGSGDFEGSFQAFGGSTVNVWGARQQALGTRPNSLPRINYLDGDSKLNVAPFFDEDEVEQNSRVIGFTLSGFSRGLFFGAASLGGGVSGCDSAADAWSDGQTVLDAGASVGGCEHWVAP
jgi:hypothetical protein